MVGTGAERIELAKIKRYSAVSAIWMVRRMMVVVRDARISWVLRFGYDFGVGIGMS